MTEKKIHLKIPIKKLLHKAQFQIFQGFLKKRFIIVLAGRRFGKSKIFCFFALLVAILKKNAIVWFVYPSYGVGEPSWRTMKNMIKKTFPKQDAVIIKETDRTIEIPNGSMIFFKSGDRPDLLRGEGVDLAIIDEMEDLKLDQVWEASLLPSLMDKKGKAVMGGTPKTNQKFRQIYEDAKKGKEGWAAFHFTSHDNPYLEPKEIELITQNLSTTQIQQEIDAEFRKDEGNIYKTSYFGDRMDITVAESRKIATVISWDTASMDKENKNIAFSAGLVGWLLDDYRLFIRKAYQAKLNFVDLDYAVKKLATQFITEAELNNEQAVIIIENKSSGIALQQSLMRTSEWKDIIFPYNPKGSKDERAEVGAKWAEKGMIVLPFHGTEEDEWLLPLEEQLYDLPNGLYRDMSDAFSQMAEYLSNQFQTRLDILQSKKARFN